jgi:hypothetical protein
LRRWLCGFSFFFFSSFEFRFIARAVSHRTFFLGGLSGPPVFFFFFLFFLFFLFSPLLFHLFVVLSIFFTFPSSFSLVHPWLRESRLCLSSPDPSAFSLVPDTKLPTVPYYYSFP